MNKLAVNDYLSSLQQQVAVSVERLKNKAADHRVEEGDNEELSYSYANGRLNAKAYSLLKSEVSYQLLNYGGEDMNSFYAAKSYESISQVNRPSTVLIDFMFANNREFDFKV